LSVLLKLGHVHEYAVVHVLTRLVLSVVVDKVAVGVEQVQNDRMVDDIVCVTVLWSLTEVDAISFSRLSYLGATPRQTNQLRRKLCKM